MNVEQKRAWFGVVLMSLGVAGVLVLWMLFGDPLAATAAFGIYGLAGLAGLIWRSSPPDERDRSIARKATLAGAIISYEVFLIGCMGTWGFVFGYHREEQVSIHVLGLITLFGGIAFFFSRSIAILVLYGRQGEPDNA